MTFTRFFGFAFLLWLILAVLKSVFLGASAPLQAVFCVLVVLVTLGCCRRLGVLNILEAGLVSAVWTIGLLLADWIILDKIFHLGIFHQGVFWFGYLIVLAAVFFGHKKRHIQIRQEMAAHHGHPLSSLAFF